MITDYYNHISVIQFGVGGTGSWLVPSMIKFLKNMRNRFSVINKKFQYTIIDDDIVEQRNTIRQNFSDWDVGRKKISAMRRHFKPIFDELNCLDFRPNTPKKFERIFLGNICNKIQFSSDSILVVIGCVDDNKPRRQLFNYLKKKFSKRYLDIPVIYFDSGNNLHNGQIVTTIFNLDYDYTFKNSKKFENPKFLKLFPANIQEEDDQSCAFFGDQSQTINTLAAGLLFANFQKIVINELIPPPIIEFNSSGMSTFKI